MRGQELLRGAACDQGLPPIRIVDDLRGVDGRVAGVIGVAARVQVSELIGAVMMAALDNEPHACSPMFPGVPGKA